MGTNERGGRFKDPASVHPASATSSAGERNERRNEHETTTVPPEVQWRSEDRTLTDPNWARACHAVHLAFLACSIAILSCARPRFERTGDDGDKVVSHHYRDDVGRCCDDVRSSGDDVGDWGLCRTFDGPDDDGGRRLRAGESRFDGDEGIFDAFGEAPEIVVGLVFFATSLSFVWFASLRVYAKRAVYTTVIGKTAIVLVLAIFLDGFLGFILACLAAFAGYFSYKNGWLRYLERASEVISHSVKAFRSNPTMFFGLVGLKLLFAMQTLLFVWVIVASFDVAEVSKVRIEVSRDARCPVAPYNETDGGDAADRYCYHDEGTRSCDGNGCLSDVPIERGGGSSFEAGCEYTHPAWVRVAFQFQILVWLWSVVLFDKLRLCVVATIVGSWHFHPERKPTFRQTLSTTVSKSTGTLSFAALIAAILDSFRRGGQGSKPCCGWWWWCGPQALFLLPLQLFACAFGSCLASILQLFTNFAVVLHVFTGLPLHDSAMRCRSIMTRHFRNGFVTELCSKNVLSVGSYVLSLLVTLTAWFWIDRRFECDTLFGADDRVATFFFLIMACFLLLHPLVGVLLLVAANSALERYERSSSESGDDNSQHIWVSPLAACFAGCVSALLIRFVNGIVSDVIDTMFLCFAIDKDNGIDRKKDEAGGDFAEVVAKAMPQYLVARPASEFDPETPVAAGVPVADLAPEAEVQIEPMTDDARDDCDGAAATGGVGRGGKDEARAAADDDLVKKKQEHYDLVNVDL